ncbi:MAG: prepilin-type N-terminal cleavage/methylation domain-containing protein [Nitrospirae bacterium]|nr:prepilin-type N-terminal cleavage/methylation domain-containing protein [Nitrospirota bacterium]
MRSCYLSTDRRGPLNRPYRQSNCGYSLIEVLIAVAIFTSMVMLSMVALNQGLTQYKRLMEEGINFRRYARTFWLHQSTAGMINYLVNDNGRWFPYFYCSIDRVSYVSASPFSSNVPVIVWIVKEKLPSTGNFALTYYELPVYAKKYEDIERDYSSSDYKKGSSFVILEDIADVRIESYVIDAVTKLWDWRTDYDAKDDKRLPSSIRISFKRQGRTEMFYLSIHTNKAIRPDPGVI